MSPEAAAIDYKTMSLNDFDNCVDFAPGHELDVPTFEEVIATKNGKPLNLTLYGREPVTKVGDVDAYDGNNGNLLSSYLMTLKNNSLPRDLSEADLEAVNVEATSPSLAKSIADAVRDFYGNHQWEAIVFDGEIDTVTRKPSSGGSEIEIVNPYSLREVAHDSRVLRYKL